MIIVSRSTYTDVVVAAAKAVKIPLSDADVSGIAQVEIISLADVSIPRTKAESLVTASCPSDPIV